MLAAVLLPAAWACARDTGYTVKVVVADRAAGHVEARFVVMPEDLRIVCEGEVRKVFEGDYVQMELDKDGDFSLKGTKTKCRQVKWLK